MNHPLVATGAALITCLAFAITLPRVLVGTPSAAVPPIQMESPSQGGAGQVAAEPGSLSEAGWPTGSVRIGPPGSEGSGPGSADDESDRFERGEDRGYSQGTSDGPAGLGENENSRESREWTFEQAEERAEREFEQREEREEREFEQQEERAEREAELRAESAEREAEQREERAEREAEQLEEGEDREADRREGRG
jgi:hypothetical protein